MANEKPKKVEKKSAERAGSPSKKTTLKKKSVVKKKETTVQKKKSPDKGATTAKEKKPIAKKVKKSPVAKSKPKVSTVKKIETAKPKKPIAKKRPETKKPVTSNLKKVVTEEHADLKIEEASKTQIEKVENVIEKLSQAPEQHYITTVPGVFRKVPGVQKTETTVHKELPIAGILNYFKNIF